MPTSPFDPASEPLGSPSSLVRDVNSKNLDIAVQSEGQTWQDRFGNVRLTIAGMIAAATTGNPAVGASQIAVTAAQRAEAARDAAILESQGIYINVEIGLAATSVSDYFSVPSTNEATFLTLYRHNGSGGASLIAEYPSAAGIRPASQSMVQRGTASDGVNLGLLQEPGTYLLSSSATYYGVPDDYDPSLNYWLTVEDTGFSNGSGSARFKLQTIVCHTFTGTLKKASWNRRLDVESPESTTGPNSWQRKLDRDENEIYLQRGQLVAETDLGDVRLPGSYLGIASLGYTGLPEDFDGVLSFWLDVSNYGGPTGQGNGRFVKQVITDTLVTDANTPLERRRSFERRMDSNSPDSTTTNSKWVESNKPRAGGGSSNFADKTIVCFGDSITEGSSSFKWPPTLQALTGATVINGGFGGCRMGIHDNETPTPNDPDVSYGEAYDPMCMHSLSDRIADDSWEVLTDAAQVLFDTVGDDNRPQAADLAELDWSTVDYAIVFYGTNDFRGTSNMGVPMGTDNDTTGDTFKGAVNRTIANINTARPGIKILFVTPLWRSRVSVNGQDSNVTPNANGVFLRDYANAIVERAKAHQIPVLDLHDECGINILNWEYYMPDGLHPYTEPGMDLVARKIVAGLGRFY